MAQNRERMNLGEYAEEATIIMDEPVKPANHFIEANTQEVTLNHLKNDCITPVFSKDNDACSAICSLPFHEGIFPHERMNPPTFRQAVVVRLPPDRHASG